MNRYGFRPILAASAIVVLLGLDGVWHSVQAQDTQATAVSTTVCALANSARDDVRLKWFTVEGTISDYRIESGDSFFKLKDSDCTIEAAGDANIGRDGDRVRVTGKIHSAAALHGWYLGVRVAEKR